MKCEDKDALLKLYELIINEEYYYLKAHQSVISFYSGIITLLVAGIVAGIFKASEWYHLGFLCVGPLLIFMISTIAIAGTFRSYQRFLEAITVRAKIEQELELTMQCSRNVNRTDLYWQLEPIIPIRHLESRKRCKSSSAFIEDLSKKGYHLWTIRLFRGFQLLSALMFLGLLYLTFVKAG